MRLSLALAILLQQQTLQAWQSYIETAERRIENERPAGDLGSIDRIKGSHTDVPGGMIHDWRGSIFVPGIKLDELLRWLQDYDHHAKDFKDVEQSKLLSRNGDTFRIFLRLKRTEIVTVHYNTEHIAVYRNDGPGRASSRSVTTRIAEVDDAGSGVEKEMPVGDDSGYLWRLNSYWRFQEQDGGVVIECESISLSRSIPFGLGWLIGRYTESIPKESLEKTLTSIRDGVRHSR